MDTFDDIPEGLRRELKAAAPRLDVPPEVDRRVRDAARLQLARRTIWWPWATAAAAVLAVTITFIAGGHWNRTPPLVVTRAPVEDDMTGDGVVDIRDALVLAQKLESAKTVTAPWDASRTLTQADVERIARNLVKLGGHGNAETPRTPRDGSGTLAVTPGRLGDDDGGAMR